MIFRILSFKACGILAFGALTFGFSAFSVMDFGVINFDKMTSSIFVSVFCPVIGTRRSFRSKKSEFSEKIENFWKTKWLGPRFLQPPLITEFWIRYCSPDISGVFCAIRVSNNPKVPKSPKKILNFKNNS